MKRFARSTCVFLACAMLFAGSGVARGAYDGSSAGQVVGSDGLPELQINAMSFPDADHGWIVGDWGFVSATDDGGQTWYRQFAPTTADLWAVFFVDATHGWALGGSYSRVEPGTILRTVDGGITWTVVREHEGEHFNAIHFADAKNGWVVGSKYDSLPYGLVWHTIDGGLTWSRQDPFAGVDPYPGRAYSAVTCYGPSTVWACAESVIAGDGYNDLHVFRSANAGASWAEISRGPYVSGGSDDLWSFTDVQFLDSSTGWLVGSLPGILRTDNGGDTWVRQDLGADTIDMFDASRGAAASWYSLMTTENGGSTWTARDPGDPLTIEYDFADVTRPAGTEVFAIATKFPGLTPPEPEYFLNSQDSGLTWSFRAIDEGNVTFIGGATRYETAVEISKATFASAETVVLATGRDFPDALAASALAGHFDGPVLLASTALPQAALGEMRRLGAGKVVIVGGTGAVSASIEAQLASEFGVERIGGSDRYETARLIAERLDQLGVDASSVFVVRGDEFADALSAAPYAASRQMPVLLVRTDEVPAATRAALEHIGASEAVVVGGTGAVSAQVAAALDALLASGVERPAEGVDRYETSSKLAEWADDKGWAEWGTVGLATGALFPDGLVGGAALGHTGEAFLLTRPDSLPPSTRASLVSHEAEIAGAQLFGDRHGAVGDNVANAIGRIVAR